MGITRIAMGVTIVWLRLHTAVGTTWMEADLLTDLIELLCTCTLSSFSVSKSSHCSLCAISNFLASDAIEGCACRKPAYTLICCPQQLRSISCSRHPLSHQLRHDKFHTLELSQRRSYSDLCVELFHKLPVTNAQSSSCSSLSPSPSSLPSCSASY